MRGPIHPEGGALLGALARETESEAGREACGFVVRARDGALWVHPVANVATGGRDGFLMDARGTLAALRWADRAGGAVVAVYHSHLEADARLSERDRAGALLAGGPAVPGADQVVISLRRGRAVAAGRYRWDGREFRPVSFDNW